MTLWNPPEYPHNLLKGLFGNSPYYHVSESIFQALRDHGGFTPSVANPFATVDFVDDLFAQKKQKSAWGRVGPCGWGGTTYRYVNIQTGIVPGGSYAGDIGFQTAPTVIATIGQFTASSTDHHGWQIDTQNVTANGFDVFMAGYSMAMDWGHWLCVGI